MDSETKFYKKERSAMKLREYFEGKQGISILSSADKDGKCTTAIYSKPHVMDDNTVAFIMRERLTYHNIRQNPHAAYMFIENSQGYQGIRLFLKKLREENNPEVIAKMTRRNLTPKEDKEKGPKHLVIFSVEMILPLVGAGTTTVTIS